MENDYANGLFSFGGQCNPNPTYENKNNSCLIKRKISSFGQVEVKWMIKSLNSSLYSLNSFIPLNGSIVFNEGQISNVIFYEKKKYYKNFSSGYK